MRNILAVDPGPEKSGWVIIDTETYDPIKSELDKNERLYDWVGVYADSMEAIIVERPICTRMAGTSISETAIVAGYVAGVANKSCPCYYITRPKVKGRIAHRGTDSDVISYLVGRFAEGEPNMGKGTKKAPGFFYGFKADIWQAYALGVVFLDMLMGANKKDIEYLNAHKI